VADDPVSDLKITRLSEAWPRAYWVAQAIPAVNEAEALARLETADLKKAVVITTDSAFESPARSDRELIPARITSYEPDRVELEISVDQPGWLVISDRWYPGWKALVDGRPTRIYPANAFVRALKIGQGPHHVVFSYHPRSLMIGAVISILGWAAVFGLWAPALKRRGQAPVSTERRKPFDFPPA